MTEPSKSPARSARSRGHFCDVLASECPCRAAGDFQPAPIQRLEALCTGRRGTESPILCFKVRAAASCSRRVDAAYLQPCGFRFQLSRFLPAEHQRLLRRLATWQLYEDFLTYSDAWHSETARRQAIRVSTLNTHFVFTHYFSELRVLFQQKMNSDGIVFRGKECGIVFFEFGFLLSYKSDQQS